MPTNRITVARKRKVRITPEAVALFRKALEIEAGGDDNVWEEDGGRQREYLDTKNQLDRLLGVKIWEPSPINADPGWDFSDLPADGTPWAQGWRRASQLRAALERALGL